MGKGKNKYRKILLVPIIIIVVVMIITLVLINMNAHKSYYKIKSRTAMINDEQKKDDNDYKTIGWLIVQGTNIDMPVIVVKNEDVEYPVEREKYAWSTNPDGKFHKKMNIMGHNIFNLSPTPDIHDASFKRFEELMAFVYYDFAKENKYIQLTMNDKDYIYKIFSVGFIPEADVISIKKSSTTDEEIKKELRIFKTVSLYDYDVDVTKNDKMISLITCTRFFGQGDYSDFVVTGRLLRKNETIDNYKIKKNNHYKKIEKLWDGELENEEDVA